MVFLLLGKTAVKSLSSKRAWSSFCRHIACIKNLYVSMLSDFKVSGILMLFMVLIG